MGEALGLSRVAGKVQGDRVPLAVVELLPGPTREGDRLRQVARAQDRLGLRRARQPVLQRATARLKLEVHTDAGVKLAVEAQPCTAAGRDVIRQQPHSEVASR